MTQGRGNKANDLLQPNFRDASGSPPNLGNAPVGHAPAPSTVRQAHSIPWSATQAAAAMREDSFKAKGCFDDAYLSHGGEAEEKHSALEPMPQTSVVGVTGRRDAHLFTEHGLKLVLSSTANRVLSDDEARDFASFLGRIA